MAVEPKTTGLGCVLKSNFRNLDDSVKRLSTGQVQELSTYRAEFDNYRLGHIVLNHDIIQIKSKI